MNTDRIYAESLVNEYAPKDTSKAVALRKLDARAKMPATVTAYCLGIAGALVMGTGMCFAMGVLGSGTLAMAGGIAIGLLGMALMALNYPLYRKLLAKGKAKYAFEIVELAREVAEGR